MNAKEINIDEIIEKLIDGEKGFRKAADNVRNPVLKNYFHDKALEKSKFVRELKLELETKGITIDENGSTSASVHRAWMDVNSVISSDNKESMLSAAVIGEKAAIGDYQKVLNNQHLDLQTRTLLEKQKNTIEKGISKIKSFKDLEK